MFKLWDVRTLHFAQKATVLSLMTTSSENDPSLAIDLFFIVNYGNSYSVTEYTFVFVGGDPATSGMTSHTTQIA